MPKPVREFVCFASTLAYESAPNITHATIDGERTLCGRKDWMTSEWWDNENPPCCRRCARAWEKLQSAEAKALAERATDLRNQARIIRESAEYEAVALEREAEELESMAFELSSE